ncbi:Rossmann-fold NAD(P)-binding domain-containing protein [Auraticoccus monumenti]|uniref:Uncharacterized conserved protein YbjT, contains NAD(P)-binding and DUF2867 domains n=1 Tax=Auraticoccus monumenti TaxID=675864 RepID=A0A1G6RQU8_9ACTN|nr:hypothetical protein [Auraticoccus monumenti]SDD06357.1 Uncharacterized conserved protein YbjT, contains NAD(P)-binding and DUF2867 domains [Auraticoccus monumenti]
MTSSSPDLHAPDPTAPVLVVGATGKTGRRVAERLRSAGVPVRAASRRSGTPFDWDDPSGWPDALAGTRSAYVTYSPDLLVPAAAGALGRLAADAREAGLEQLVLLSGRNEPGAARAVEAARAAGIPVTVLEAAWFLQNVTEGDFAPMVADGVLALPVGEVPEPFVDVDDVAEVAVAALLDEAHRGRTYQVTGPRSLTFGELAAELSRTSGREVRWVELGMAEAVDGWRAAGLPEEVVQLLGTLFGELFDGRSSRPADGVQQVLGRPARDVREHLAHHAAAQSQVTCGATRV